VTERHPDPVIQGILDRNEIHDLVVRYARALDARDWALLESCFVPGASYSYPNGGSSSRAEIVERCTRALTRLDASQHLVGNIEITVDGDSASTIVYFQAQHVLKGTPGGDCFIIAGSYRDTLARTPEGWRITHRSQDYAWMDGNPGVVARPDSLSVKA
jgi:3-phenylpropionate/cinnamic acid dioxygenase small subunit